MDDEIWKDGHCGLCCTESAACQVPEIEGWHDSEGRLGDVFLMSPDFISLTFVEGIWNEVNTRCGTSFGNYEDEVISPCSALLVSQVIREIARRYLTGEIRRVVGWKYRPTRKEWVASMPAWNFRKILVGFARKLVDFACRGANVYVSL